MAPSPSVQAFEWMCRDGLAGEALQSYTGDPDGWINSRTGLGLAAERGHYATCCDLITSLGADVNAKDPFGWSPLHYAALSDQWDLTRLLGKHRANPDQKITIHGRAPLHLAVSTNLVAILIGELGADPNNPDRTGKVPIRHWYYENGAVAKQLAMAAAEAGWNSGTEVDLWRACREGLESTPLAHWLRDRTMDFRMGNADLAW